MDALKKEPGRPFVVFLDVNLPGSDGPAEAPSWIREIEEKTLPRLSRTERERMNLAIFTSIPFHYASPDSPIPSSIVTAHQPNHPPTFPIGQEVLESLIEATRLLECSAAVFPRAALLIEALALCRRVESPPRKTTSRVCAGPLNGQHASRIVTVDGDLTPSLCPKCRQEIGFLGGVFSWQRYANSVGVRWPRTPRHPIAAAPRISPTNTRGVTPAIARNSAMRCAWS